MFPKPVCFLLKVDLPMKTSATMAMMIPPIMPGWRLELARRDMDGF
jgi:hypothetical protein